MNKIICGIKVANSTQLNVIYEVRSPPKFECQVDASYNPNQ